MTIWQKLWYSSSKLRWLLYPLSFIFLCIVIIRKKMYHCHILKSYKIPVPVVIVGNITVGGTGKTPLVIYLVELLQNSGYKVGIISRGYKSRAKKYPFIIDTHTTVEEAGDEPFLMYKKLRCPIAISKNKIDACQLLLKETNINIIISDDGLQHYRLQRDIEIAVVDADRVFGNQLLLPAGPLREPVSRIKDCHFVIYQGNTLENNNYHMTYITENIKQLIDNKEKTPQGKIIAIAGIGHPDKFFNTLKSINIVCERYIPFSDHAHYHPQKLQQLMDNADALIMTEKDAIKCFPFAIKNWYYLPIKAKLSQEFDQLFLKKMKELL